MFFHEDSPFNMSDPDMALQRYCQLVDYFQRSEPQNPTKDKKMVEYMDKEVSPFVEVTAEYNAKQILIYGDSNRIMNHTNNNAESMNSLLRRKIKFKCLMVHHLAEVIVEKQDRDMRDFTSAIREGASNFVISPVWLAYRRAKKPAEKWPIPNNEWMTSDARSLKKLEDKVAQIHVTPDMSRADVIKVLADRERKNKALN